MIFLYILIALILFIAIIYAIQISKVSKGRKLAEAQYAQMPIEKFTSTDALQHITLTPLIDSESTNTALKTENGVSYLIETDQFNLLLDLGFNQNGEHPSPLLHNMDKLNKSFDEIDAIVISHAHLDHIGGMQEQQKRQFSLSQGQVDTPRIPVYVPTELTPSAFNSQLDDIHISTAPSEIAPGIYTIGVIPRHLFLLGRIEEQALALRLAGKGIVLIIGCGHQSIQRIIERTQALFDDPIYAVIGGLHLPINQKTSIARIQSLVGSDYPPHQGLSKKDVHAAIASLQNADVQIISLSPHDSSGWSLQQFKTTFAENYINLKVGQSIQLREMD